MPKMQCMGTAVYLNRRCRVGGTVRVEGWVGCANHPRRPGTTASLPAEPIAEANGEAQRRAKGTPRKSPTGLDKVLFVRADKRLLDKLEKEWERRCERNPGMVISKADVARSLIWEGLARAEKER
jgi:hypothetical protein